MSLSSFIKRVRIAASPFPPEAWADPTMLTTKEFDRAMQFEDIWLAPVTVKGFSGSESELHAFSPPVRERLRTAVAMFRSVADQILPGTRATTDQVREALPHFATILDILKSHLAAPESLAVRRAIWRAVEPYRDWILTFDFEFKEDSAGDPSVWVWLILKDDVDVETREVQHKLYDVRDTIRKEFDADGISRRLYASVWGRSEIPSVLAWEPV